VLKNNIDVKPGDYVELEAIQKSIMKYITIIYMIPFAFLILGIVLGSHLFSHLNGSSRDLSSFGIGILFLAISFVIIRIIDRRFAKNEENVIVMTRKL
jgi:sigma-E factor negative regulatory protein RseC